MRANYIEDLQTWESEFSFHTEIPVRFSDTDMFGHLNNTKVFVYFEDARIQYLQTLTKVMDEMKRDPEVIPVVADLQCDFVKQIFFDEKLKIFVKANSLGTTSVDLHYMGKNTKNEIVFTGRGTVVQINKGTGRPVAWSEEEKKVFLQYA
ncbi:acyl-CoA thioesterase [Sporosarcina cascadiensis]|uniref:acyl-CoA thioesterase n=1 Tax=Sporosarcina cascadiensis TaxID=2660747 RepID=UPI00129B55E8|nr:thioesterase family protein [Sporosarcina cascadiensis]